MDTFLDGNVDSTGIAELGIGQDNRRNDIEIKIKNPSTENLNKSHCHQHPRTTSSNVKPKSISKPTDKALKDSTTSFLLRILTDEISRDGGACLVTSLKDYIIDGNGHREPLKVQSFSSSSSTTSKIQSEFCNKSKKRRNQQLNSLLIHSNVGKPKLLAFLESHPNVFRVDRSVIPHWVELVTALTMSLKPQIATSNRDVMREMIANSVSGFERTETTTRNGTIADAYPLREDLRTKLFHKALYILRKRQARIDRRKRKTSSCILVRADKNSNTMDINERSDIGVYCHWLLRQCSWELHFLLRYCDFYRNLTLCGYGTPSDVKQVGSKGWEDITLPIFERLLRTGKHNTSCNGNGGELMIISWIRVQAGKAALRQSSSDKEYRKQLDTNGNDDDGTKVDFIVRSSFAGDEGERGNGCEEMKQGIRKNRDSDKDDAIVSLVHRIDQTLTEIVCRKDGGHQVSLQLLLHRYPNLKELLGGRDLWTLYCDFSDCENDNNSNKSSVKNTDSSVNDPRCLLFFQSISMFYNGSNLILRSKRSKTNECVVINDDYINKNSYKEKRMKVDEEGLYSVTNNKWGRAMSNLIIQACRQTNIFGEQPSVNRVNDQEQEGLWGGREESCSSNTVKTVVDLTASIGGMTLALAKSNYFDRVLALEIEEGRAGLCRENLSRHGFYDDQNGTTTSRTIVKIFHQDSIEQIPFLPRRACFVIDPPWGGYDYKEKVRRQQEKGGQLLKLGDTSLEDVLVMMSHHNSPCVVGLRLPTNFSVQHLLIGLREKEETIEFECLTCRKISVQLFVVLHFPQYSV